MRRFTVTVLAAAAIVATAGFAVAKSDALDRLMTRYFTWALGGNQPDHDGDVVFLPVPAGDGPDADGVFQGEADVTMKAKQPFFLPIFVFYGERYDDGTLDDDPADHSLIPSKEDFLDADVLVEVDGHPYIDGSRDLHDLFVAPQYFKKAIVYDAPTDYHSVAALWIEGLGFEHGGLSKGAHTLHLRITSDFLRDTYGFAGWENTWHLTVKK